MCDHDGVERRTNGGGTASGAAHVARVRRSQTSSGATPSSTKVPAPASRTPAGATRSDRARAASAPVPWLRGPGRHLSAWTVLLLTGLTALAFVLPGGARGVIAVVALACLGLASGWSALARSRVSRIDASIIALAGVATAAVVGTTGEMSWAPALMGVSVVALVTVEIFTAPSPHDHSRPDGTAPGAPPPQWLRAGSFPTMAVAVTAVPIAVGGASWAALAWNQGWSETTLLACAVTAVVVIGDQIGRTFRTQSLAALVVGVVAGLVVASVVAWAGSAGQLVPTVLPALAGIVGESAALVLHGVLTGIAVSLAVIAVDALFGEHRRPTSRSGAIARGCAKFLVSAVPVYMMMRIGGA